jgi:putative tryptophan/tyrosine transport system substrate-binding protein
MRRREFIAGLGGAAVWLGIGSLIARAQRTANPVIGFLSIETSNDLQLLPQYHDGLREAGFVEGQNVAVEYRWAGNEYDWVPALAAELVQRRVSVIVARPRCELQAKNATATIPIAFCGYGRSDQVGSRPKPEPAGRQSHRHYVVRERSDDEAAWAAAPDRARRQSDSIFERRDEKKRREPGVRAGAGADGGAHHRRFDPNCERQQRFRRGFRGHRPGRAFAVFVGASAHLFAQRERLAAAAARYRIPASCDHIELTEAAGLMSYGVNISASFRQVGLYTGRILKGEKPRDLPVVPPTKFELAINLKAGKALGLEVPPTLLAVADEVIE